MGKTTSTERMRKMREKRKNDPNYDVEKERENERERIKNLRAKKKLMPKDDATLKAEKEKEKIRKRNYRKRQKQQVEESGSSVDGRQAANKKRGVKDRRKNLKKTVDKIKLFSNNIRRLKRQNKNLMAQLPESSPSPSPSPGARDSVMLNAISPAAKKKELNEN